MAVTVIYDDQATSVANAQAQSNDLWMPLGELRKWAHDVAPVLRAEVP